MRIPARDLCSVNVYTRNTSTAVRIDEDNEPSYNDGRTIEAAIYPLSSKYDYQIYGERVQKMKLMHCYEDLEEGTLVSAADINYKVIESNNWNGHVKVLLEQTDN